MKKFSSLLLTLLCLSVAINASSCNSTSKENDSLKVSDTSAAVDTPASEKAKLPAVIDINNQEMMEALFADCEWLSADGTGSVYTTFNADGTGVYNDMGDVENFKWKYDAETKKLTITDPYGKSSVIVKKATINKIDTYEPQYKQSNSYERVK